MSHVLLKNEYDQLTMLIRDHKAKSFRSLPVLIFHDCEELYFNLYIKRWNEYHDEHGSQDIYPELIDDLDIPTAADIVPS